MLLIDLCAIEMYSLKGLLGLGGAKLDV